jgi:hypothetical protein
MADAIRPVRRMQSGGVVQTPYAPRDCGKRCGPCQIAIDRPRRRATTAASVAAARPCGRRLAWITRLTASRVRTRTTRQPSAGRSPVPALRAGRTPAPAMPATPAMSAAFAASRRAIAARGRVGRRRLRSRRTRRHRRRRRSRTRRRRRRRGHARPRRRRCHGWRGRTRRWWRRGRTLRRRSGRGRWRGLGSRSSRGLGSCSCGLPRPSLGSHALARRFLRRLRCLLRCLLRGALLGGDFHPAALARRCRLFRRLAPFRFLRSLGHDRPPDRSPVQRSRAAGRIASARAAAATDSSPLPRSDVTLGPRPLASSEPPASDLPSPNRSARSDAPPECPCPPRSG